MHMIGGHKQFSFSFLRKLKLTVMNILLIMFEVQILASTMITRSLEADKKKQTKKNTTGSGKYTRSIFCEDDLKH